MSVPKCAVPVVLFLALFVHPISAEQTPDEGKWLKLEKDGVTIEYQEDTRALAEQLLPKVAAIYRARPSDPAVDLAKLGRRLTDLQGGIRW